MNYQRLNLANFLGRKAKIGNNLSLAAASYLLLNLGASASAQVIRDNTLPNNSLVNQNGNLIEILEGTTAGSNLFHSFEQFSLIQGETAWFNNATTIENILTRVTGNSISDIDGLIRANGSANLFLINPNGIIFGPNAILDIGGSFVSSTAESIQFSDGSFYSAVDPQAPPLLTINIPLGLQYGAEPGNIIVRGIGNNTGFRDPSVNDFSLVKYFRPTGLQVAEGNTLALIGGNIDLDGGNLTAAEGHIELGSVKEGLVQFDANNEIETFDYQEVTGFQDIALVNAASVEVSGNSSGTVNVQGQNISLSDASAILSNTSGDGATGSINLKGTESIKVKGVSRTQIPFVTYVSTDTTPGSSGTGADLTIDTNYLLVAGGAQISSAAFSSGDAGRLSIKAERVELIGGAPLAGPSGVFAPVAPSATGRGGSLNFEVDSLFVAGGAQAVTGSFSSGRAGDFNIEAKEIEITGTSPGGFASGLFSNSVAQGAGGNLNIITEQLSLTEGGDVSSNVFGNGTAGNINIKANTIELSNLSNQQYPSFISASVQLGATGLGGDITIDTNSLSLSHGSLIDSSIFGAGEGGNVTVTAQEINLNGYSTIVGQPTGLLATVLPGATGNSGNMTITTDNLRVSEGAQIAVSTGGSGSAGDLTLTASDSVKLMGNAIEFGGGSSGLFSNAVVADGNGGNIDLTTNQLIIKDGATINVSNFLSRNSDVPAGTGTAGNIKINAQTIELDGVDADTPASINAATFVGGGGNLVINSERMTVTNGAQVTAETIKEGDGGSIIVSASEFNLNNQAQVSVNSIGQGQAGDIAISSENITLDESEITATSEKTGGGDINLKAEFISLDNNSLISTSVLDSTGGGGDLTINSDYIIANHNSNLKADAVFGPGGNINITTQAIFFSPDSKATASSQFGVDGLVEIDTLEGNQKIAVVALESEIVDRSGMISSLCSTDLDDRMIVSGKGGLEENPSQALRGQSIWEDLRDFSLASNNDDGIYQTKSSSNNRNPATIVEANNWLVNAQGKVELVTNVPIAFNQCKE